MCYNRAVPGCLLDELRAYVGFGQADEEALKALQTLARPHYVEITEVFYDQLRQFDAAAAVLTSPEQTERLKVTLRSWMDRTLGGPWDREYVELRSRIGHVHVKVGLPQRYMFTAMSVIRQELEAIAEDLPDPIATQRSLGKILDIDLAIMLETYREDSLAQVRRFEDMEKALLERRVEISETRYHELVENAGVMMIAVAENDHIVLFNRQAEEVTDYRRSEVLGKPFLDALASEADRDKARQALARVRRGAEATGFDASLVTRAGEVRAARWRVTELASPSGVLACVIGLDITDELALAERTERAERLAGLGTLAAGLAHEIRNPLNSAKLQLTLMERRLGRAGADARERALEASHVVALELTRLAGLVEEFLDFARPRNLRLMGADLAETARTVVNLIEPELEEGGIRVSTRLDGQVAARYDDERIKQVLLNLLRNAAEAAGPGGAVGLSVARTGNKAIVEVTDSGDGPPEDTDIFAPFTTDKEGGTGLGLPIVDRIVSAHGGAVSWRRDKETTVFCVELPLDGPAPVT